MRDHDISQRRACRLVGVDPKTVRRVQTPDNPEVREEMKAIASKRRRFGYRRIGVLLERKGMIMNHKKLYRLYTEEKLGVRRRRVKWSCFSGQVRGLAKMHQVGFHAAFSASVWPKYAASGVRLSRAV
jgi:hypothetical protein